MENVYWKTDIVRVSPSLQKCTTKLVYISRRGFEIELDSALKNEQENIKDGGD